VKYIVPFIKGRNMLGFAAALFKEHGQKVIQTLQDRVVDLDPATASAAELHVMEQSLDKVGAELEKFRIYSQHEHADAAAVQARFDRMNTAASALNDRYAAETDDAKKADLEKSLAGLLTTLEGIKSELDQHNSLVADADQMVAETESIYQEKAEALRSAKATLAKAAHDLEMSHVQADHAKEQAEHAAELAGLRDDKTDGLNAALTSMQRQTEAARGVAEAAKLKAQVLHHADAGSMDDPNVLAALAAVEPAPSVQSFADRLAALNAKK
jgi:chromosome segregation ATPase